MFKCSLHILTKRKYLKTALCLVHRLQSVGSTKYQLLSKWPLSTVFTGKSHSLIKRRNIILFHAYKKSGTYHTLIINANNLVNNYNALYFTELVSCNLWMYVQDKKIQAWIFSFSLNLPDLPSWHTCATLYVLPCELWHCRATKSWLIF